MARPETRYAKSGDVHIAYQVVGSGPVDLVYISNGYYSHVEHSWEEPRLARALERLGSFSRLIHYDRRGIGLSDSICGPATLEERMDDVLAVMDAVGSEQAVLLGLSEGGVMAQLFAATFPARTASLVLYGTWATMRRGPDHGEKRMSWLSDTWGTEASAEHTAPSLAQDARFRAWWASWERYSSGPGDVAAQFRAAWGVDTRGVLPTIRVPTLVLHRRNDCRVAARHGRAVAEGIPTARYVELDGIDHFPWARDAEQVPGRDRGVPDGGRLGTHFGQRAGHPPLHRHRRVNVAGGRPGRP